MRGHQVCEEGFDYPFFPRKCQVTVFSASSYDEASENKAAFVTVLGWGSGFDVTQLPYAPPSREGKRPQGDFVLTPTEKAQKEKITKKKKKIHLIKKPNALLKGDAKK